MSSNNPYGKAAYQINCISQRIAGICATRTLCPDTTHPDCSAWDKFVGPTERAHTLKAELCETQSGLCVGRFKTLIDDLANVTQPQVNQARGLLRMLLGKEMVPHPQRRTGQNATLRLTGRVMMRDYCGLPKRKTNLESREKH